MSARSPIMGPGVLRRAARPMHQGHHTRAPDAAVELVHPTHLERLLHAGRGVMLLKAHLGVSMQIAPELGEFGMELTEA